MNIKMPVVDTANIIKDIINLATSQEVISNGKKYPSLLSLVLEDIFAHLARDRSLANMSVSSYKGFFFQILGNALYNIKSTSRILSNINEISNINKLILESPEILLTNAEEFGKQLAIVLSIDENNIDAIKDFSKIFESLSLFLNLIKKHDPSILSLEGLQDTKKLTQLITTNISIKEEFVNLGQNFTDLISKYYPFFHIFLEEKALGNTKTIAPHDQKLSLIKNHSNSSANHSSDKNSYFLNSIITQANNENKSRELTDEIARGVFTSMDFSYIKLNYIFAGVIFTGSKFNNVSFKNAKFESTYFSLCEFSGVIDLTDAVFDDKSLDSFMDALNNSLANGQVISLVSNDPKFIVWNKYAASQIPENKRNDSQFQSLLREFKTTQVKTRIEELKSTIMEFGLENQLRAFLGQENLMMLKLKEVELIYRSQTFGEAEFENILDIKMELYENLDAKNKYLIIYEEMQDLASLKNLSPSIASPKLQYLQEQILRYHNIDYEANMNLDIRTNMRELLKNQVPTSGIFQLFRGTKKQIDIKSLPLIAEKTPYEPVFRTKSDLSKKREIVRLFEYIEVDVEEAKIHLLYDVLLNININLTLLNSDDINKLKSILSKEIKEIVSEKDKIIEIIQKNQTAKKVENNIFSIFSQIIAKHKAEIIKSIEDTKNVYAPGNELNQLKTHLLNNINFSNILKESGDIFKYLSSDQDNFKNLFNYVLANADNIENMALDLLKNEEFIVFFQQNSTIFVEVTMAVIGQTDENKKDLTKIFETLEVMLRNPKNISVDVSSLNILSTHLKNIIVNNPIFVERMTDAIVPQVASKKHKDSMQNLIDKYLSKSLERKKHISELVMQDMPKDSFLDSYVMRQLRANKFEGVEISKVYFDNLLLESYSFATSTLKNVSFAYAQLFNVDFSDTVFQEGVVFTGCKMDLTTYNSLVKAVSLAKQNNINIELSNITVIDISPEEREKINFINWDNERFEICRIVEMLVKEGKIPASQAIEIRNKTYKDFQELMLDQQEIFKEIFKNQQKLLGISINPSKSLIETFHEHAEEFEIAKKIAEKNNQRETLEEKIASNHELEKRALTNDILKIFGGTLSRSLGENLTHDNETYFGIFLNYFISRFVAPRLDHFYNELNVSSKIIKSLTFSDFILCINTLRNHNNSTNNLLEIFADLGWTARKTTKQVGEKYGQIMASLLESNSLETILMSKDPKTSELLPNRNFRTLVEGMMHAMYLSESDKKKLELQDIEDSIQHSIHINDREKVKKLKSARNKLSEEIIALASSNKDEGEVKFDTKVTDDLLVALYEIITILHKYNKLESLVSLLYQDFSKFQEEAKTIIPNLTNEDYTILFSLIAKVAPLFNAIPNLQQDFNATKDVFAICFDEKKIEFKSAKSEEITPPYITIANRDIRKMIASFLVESKHHIKLPEKNGIEMSVFHGSDQAKVSLSNLYASSLKAYYINAIYAEFTGWKIKKADFSVGNYSRSNFKGSEFSDSKMELCVFNESNFENTIFKNGSNFNKSTLFKCSAKQCSFYKVLFYQTHVESSVFNETIISESILKDSKFLSTTFNKCEFKSCKISNSIFAKSTFNDVEISNTTFANCNFKGANFTNCTFNKVEFKDCVLDAKFFIEMLKNPDKFVDFKFTNVTIQCNNKNDLMAIENSQNFIIQKSSKNMDSIFHVKLDSKPQTQTKPTNNRRSIFSIGI